MFVDSNYINFIVNGSSPMKIEMVHFRPWYLGGNNYNIIAIIYIINWISEIIIIL